LVSALSSRDDHESAHDSGICQLRASRLEVAAAGSSSGSSGEVIPVNRDGEPEDASSRWVWGRGEGCLNRGGKANEIWLDRCWG
jgi:hypothetical protein